MSTYRNGNRNARNIYRVGPDGEQHIGCAFTEDDGRLIVEALNGTAHRGHNHPVELDDYCEDQAEAPAGPWTVPVDHAYVGDGPTCSKCTRSRVLHEVYWAGPADSCSCTKAGPTPGCPVHQGRRARGPKPPPLGPGCICDGSGRTCPRHGAVT